MKGVKESCKRTLVRSTMGWSCEKYGRPKLAHRADAQKVEGKMETKKTEIVMGFKLNDT